MSTSGTVGENKLKRKAPTKKQTKIQKQTLLNTNSSNVNYTTSGRKRQRSRNLTLPSTRDASNFPSQITAERNTPAPLDYHSLELESLSKNSKTSTEEYSMKAPPTPPPQTTAMFMGNEGTLFYPHTLHTHPGPSTTFHPTINEAMISLQEYKKVPTTIGSVDGQYSGGNITNLVPHKKRNHDQLYHNNFDCDDPIPLEAVTTRYHQVHHGSPQKNRKQVIVYTEQTSTLQSDYSGSNNNSGSTEMARQVSNEISKNCKTFSKDTTTHRREEQATIRRSTSTSNDTGSFAEHNGVTNNFYPKQGPVVSTTHNAYVQSSYRVDSNDCCGRDATQTSRNEVRTHSSDSAQLSSGTTLGVATAKSESSPSHVAAIHNQPYCLDYSFDPSVLSENTTQVHSGYNHNRVICAEYAGNYPCVNNAVTTIPRHIDHNAYRNFQTASKSDPIDRNYTLDGSRHQHNNMANIPFTESKNPPQQRPQPQPVKPIQQSDVSRKTFKTRTDLIVSSSNESNAAQYQRLNHNPLPRGNELFHISFGQSIKNDVGLADMDSTCSQIEDFQADETGNNNKGIYQVPTSGLVNDRVVPTASLTRPQHNRTHSIGSNHSWLTKNECTFHQLVEEPNVTDGNNNSNGYPGAINIRSRSCSPIIDDDDEPHRDAEANMNIAPQTHDGHHEERLLDDSNNSRDTYYSLSGARIKGTDVGGYTPQRASNQQDRLEQMNTQTEYEHPSHSNNSNMLPGGQSLPFLSDGLGRKCLPAASATATSLNRNENPASFSLLRNEARLTQQKSSTGIKHPPSWTMLTSKSIQQYVRDASVSSSGTRKSKEQSSKRKESMKTKTKKSSLSQRSDVSERSSLASSKSEDTSKTDPLFSTNVTTQDRPWIRYLECSNLVELSYLGYVSDTMLFSMAQMRMCGLTRDDRVGKYIRHEIGYVGLCCKHCTGQPGFGRYFPSTFNSFLNGNNGEGIINHVLKECRSCPDEIRKILIEIYETEQSKKHKAAHGFRKLFFQTIWAKLRAAPIVDLDNSSSSVVNSSRNDERKPSPRYMANNRSSNMQTQVGSSDGNDDDENYWRAIIGESDLVSIEDRHLVQDSIVIAFSQMKRCGLQESDRTGRFKTTDVISVGLCCKYCCGGNSGKPGNGRYFPKSQRSLAQVDSCQQIVRHIAVKCDNCPKFIRDCILSAIKFEATDSSKYSSRYGSRTIFYRRVWLRLHGENTFCSVHNEHTQTDRKGDPKSTEYDIPWHVIIGDSQLVSLADRNMVPPSELAALAQMKPCRLTESDRIGRFKRHPIGMGGLTCKHCVGRPSNGRYFPKSAQCFGQTTCGQTIMTHITNYCDKTPTVIRDAILKLKALEGSNSSLSKTGNLVHGARKAFYERLWDKIQNQEKGNSFVSNAERPEQVLSYIGLPMHSFPRDISTAPATNAPETYRYRVEEQQQHQVYHPIVNFPWLDRNSQSSGQVHSMIMNSNTAKFTSSELSNRSSSEYFDVSSTPSPTCKKHRRQR